MKYFEATEIFFAALCAFGYGAVSGVLLCVTRILCSDINRLLHLPHLAYINASPFSVARIRKSAYADSLKSTSRVVFEICEMIFFFIFGVGFIIISYMMLDAEIRVFMLLLAAFGFVLSKATVGRFALMVLESAYKKIYFMALIFLVILLIPIKGTVAIIYKRLISPLMLAFKGLIAKNIHKTFVKKKLKAALKLPDIYVEATKNSK